MAAQYLGSSGIRPTACECNGRTATNCPPGTTTSCRSQLPARRRQLPPRRDCPTSARSASEFSSGTGCSCATSSRDFQASRDRRSAVSDSTTVWRSGPNWLPSTSVPSSTTGPASFRRTTAAISGTRSGSRRHCYATAAACSSTTTNATTASCVSSASTNAESTSVPSTTIKSTALVPAVSSTDATRAFVALALQLPGGLIQPTAAVQ